MENLNSRYKKSAEYFEKSKKTIPAGVNSTARSIWAGWNPYPLFIESGNEARLQDVDGNIYIDYLLGLGPMLFGHRPKKITDRVIDAITQKGTIFALPTLDETILSELIIKNIPSIEQIRLCNTGTEAVLYSLRLARAYTNKSKIIRFEGMYHGFSDTIYWSKHPSLDNSGTDQSPKPIPQGPGLISSIAENLIILPWNDSEALKNAIDTHKNEIAAIITEPIMCNTGCILPNPGYLELMRDLSYKNNIVLIYDEVITGFRLGISGAQGFYKIKPDLTVFAKGLGGGFPIAALGGCKKIMDLVSDGIVSMAGTYTANTIAVAAAIAAMEEMINNDIHSNLFKISNQLQEGLSKILFDYKIPSDLVGVGPIFQIWFTNNKINNYRDAARYCNHQLFRKWWQGNLNNGILFHPGAYENLFISFAHNSNDIMQTLDVANYVLKNIDN
jgi:glutamate-1-semialdehyde 2,1-aminomutase